MAGAVFSPAYKRLVEVLVAARNEAGLTQVQLAQRLGKPQSYVSKVERAERRIDVIEFAAIADAVQVSAPMLLARALTTAHKNG